MEQPCYPCPVVEWGMNVQEVLLRAIDGGLKWYWALEVLGISAR